jgi:hypothetical protein
LSGSIALAIQGDDSVMLEQTDALIGKNSGLAAESTSGDPEKIIRARLKK